MEKGYIHLYTGNGKGKTTAALGITLRAAGNGFNVAVGQFIKSKNIQYSEIKALELINAAGAPFGEIIVRQFGRGCCIHGEATQADYDGAREGLEQIKEWIHSGKWDVVILDEINVALHLKLLSTENIVDLLKNKPTTVEVILTGRNAPQELIDLADVVTEMKEIKHYYTKGVISRAGIDS